MSEEARQHVLERVIDLPVLRRHTEIAAEPARLLQTRCQILERRRRDETVTAELGVSIEAKRVRIHHRGGPVARRQAAEPLDAAPVRERAAIPWTVRRTEREE